MHRVESRQFPLVLTRANESWIIRVDERIAHCEELGVSRFIHSLQRFALALSPEVIWISLSPLSTFHHRLMLDSSQEIADSVAPKTIAQVTTA